ncbi:hypothetical protein [Candidatus Magnetomonas plexicatena]|uniref:hypothetical protein n=1 Tax=Candidatus Magnetomonas plexicatena TaxID=2552947 RepID=UPI001C74C1AD|nr:hypothetical protein E2O03_004225 [Nitrospirales bacterium LBB_01]
MKLTLADGCLSAKNIQKKTGFPLVGGNDKGGDTFLFLSFLRKQESSSLLTYLTIKTI